MLGMAKRPRGRALKQRMMIGLKPGYGCSAKQAIRGAPLKKRAYRPNGSAGSCARMPLPSGAGGNGISATSDRAA